MKWYWQYKNVKNLNITRCLRRSFFIGRTRLHAALLYIPYVQSPCIHFSLILNAIKARKQPIKISRRLICLKAAGEIL